MSPTPFWNRHPRGELSAYADSELSSDRATRLESHLASCAACRAELAGVRETKATLSALTEVDAPRSFALTPQMADKPVALPHNERDRQAPAFGLRIASAGLAVALAVVAFADVRGGDDATSNTGADDLALRATSEIAADSADGLYASEAAGGADMDRNGEASPKYQDGGSGVSVPTPTPVAQVPETAVPVPSPAGAGVGSAPTPADDGSLDAGATEAVGEDRETDAPPEALTDEQASPNELTLDQVGSDSNAEAENSPAAVDSSGGSDTLRIAEIMLGAGLVLALAASVVVTRLGRRPS